MKALKIAVLWLGLTSLLLVNKPAQGQIAYSTLEIQDRVLTITAGQLNEFEFDIIYSVGPDHFVDFGGLSVNAYPTYDGCVTWQSPTGAQMNPSCFDSVVIITTDYAALTVRALPADDGTNWPSGGIATNDPAPTFLDTGAYSAQIASAITSGDTTIYGGASLTAVIGLSIDANTTENIFNGANLMLAFAGALFFLLAGLFFGGAILRYIANNIQWRM